MLGTHNNLGESSLYLNLGFWKEARAYDEAGAALARKVGTTLGIGADDHVLDVGCGFADQDILWVDELRPRRITGINITASQVQHGQRRVRERGYDDRIEMVQASATALPFPSDSFDKLVSLEAAFHFVTRADFFHEAARVLKPGGVIVIADLVPGHRRPRRPALVQWLRDFLGQSFWQFPRANLYGIDVYIGKLRAAGFSDITIDDISEHVFLPFKAYARVRTAEPSCEARLHPLIRAMWRSGADRYHPEHRELDYVIVKATRA